MIQSQNERLAHGVRNVLALMLFAALFSCGGDGKLYNEDGLLVRRGYYDDGVTLEMEETFKDDSIRHGYAKTFYENGSLEWSSEFVDGKEHGAELMFFRNGSKKMVGWNENGLQDSSRVYYDSLGSIVATQFWKRGKQIGEQIEYYPNQKTKACFYYDPLERLLFRRSYDTLGSFTEEGSRSPNFVMTPSGHGTLQYLSGQHFTATIYLCRCKTSEKWTLELTNTETGDVIDKQNLDGEELNILYIKQITEAGTYQLNVFNETGISNQVEFLFK